MTEPPPGALDPVKARRWRYSNPDKTIYLAGNLYLRRRTAKNLQFTLTPPRYYFENYWLAYAYAVKRGLKREVRK